MKDLHIWITGFLIMGKFIEYKIGEKVGNCVYLGDVGWQNHPNGDRSRLALFKCPYDDNKFVTTISNVKRPNGTTSCGCVRLEAARKASTKHGLRQHPLYDIWCRIKQRCYNKNDGRYKDWGGRGIVMCDEWKNSPKTFIDYVTKLSHYGESGMTIDRIKNDQGYKPGNVRWADYHTQGVNSRPQSNNTSGFVGVSFRKRSCKWMTQITIYGVKRYLGYHDTPEQAVQARNDYIIANNLTEYVIQQLVS